MSVSGSCLITVVMSEGTSATIVQLFTGQAPGWPQSQNIENKFIFLIMLLHSLTHCQNEIVEKLLLKDKLSKKLNIHIKTFLPLIWTIYLR